MTIQYQGVWSLQSAAQLQSTQRWVTDPLYKNTTLLLQADDAANGAQNNTFLDSSSNAFAITRNGGNPGMTQGTFSPFSPVWSNYFNGSTSYITLPASSNWLFNGDACLEAWVYRAANTDGVIFATGGASSADQFGIFVSEGLWWGVTAQSGLPLPNINEWAHCVVTRSGSTIRRFINGVLVSTATNASAIGTSGGTAYIGARSGSSVFFNGYISNLRVINGSIPTTYQTSSTTLGTVVFTPPTTAATTTSQGATSGDVKLITCQSNRFVDTSSTPSSLTPVGSPSVQPFSPFAPQYQWTPSVIGGSGFFDGTTDTLTAANNAAFQFGTGDFEVSGWVYPTSYASVRGFFGNGGQSNGTLFAYLTTAGKFESWIYGDATQTPTINIPLNAWTYLTVSRVGTTFRTFVNGVQDISYNTSRDISAQGCIVGDAFTNGGFLFQGYISSVRVRKGSGVSSVTVPTAPSTAITNTQLLLNFTNAGIYDGTMKNVLETVGNAQISTAVVKYGSGSMYFDGTGDYLLSTESNICAFGLGDFTIEFWFYLNTTSGTQNLIDPRPASTTGAYTTLYTSGGTIRLFTQTTDRITSSSVSTNVWFHVALCRSGTSTRMFFNGVQTGSTYTDTNNYVSSRLVIGAGFANTASITNTMNGYIDDLRITRFARYIQDFIPPSVALPRQ